MEDGDEKARALAYACQEAFQLYPRSCSHAVHHVIKFYKPDQPYMQANQLLASVSKSNEWKEVPLSELSRLANRGALIIGGLNAVPHGHIIVVHPGGEKPKGGYFFTSRRTGEKKMSAFRGMYARAMSTSMSSDPFPGTVSNGDKTVADPWSTQDFKSVRFWQYVGKIPADNRQKEKLDKFLNTSEKIWI